MLLLVLTHRRDLRLGVVDVEGIEVSHPLLKARLGAVDVKDVTSLAGDRRIPKHPNSALERVLDSRRFEVVRCVAQIAFFALRINLLTVVEHTPLVFLHQRACMSCYSAN